MTKNPIAATAVSLLALGLMFGVTPAMAAKMDVTIGMQLEPPNLDPTGGAAAAIDEVVYANVFEGLTRFGADGSILPALAESWEISDDGLVYTFKLHTGVKFHDGSDFNADDVKFSLDRARAEGSTNAQKALFADIASVDVVDPATVKVTLSKPNGSFLFNMAWGDAVIVAPETAADNAANPVGTGPFTLTEWVKGDRVELGRYDGYWGTPVKLDKVTFKFISDPTAAFAAMMAGDLDAYPAFPAPENLVQFEADPRFEVITGSSEGETILAMNNKKAPLDNIKVREAIAHAIDRQAIIDGAMFGYGTPIGTFLSPANPDYIDLTEQSNYDPEKSKALLAEAGATDLTLSMKLPPVEGYARRGGEIIANQLNAVGIKTEVTNLEWAQWLSEVFTDKNFDLTIISHTEPNDIGIFARPDYYFQYNNEEFNQIIADLAVTADPAARSELLEAAQRNLADNYAVGFLFELAKVGVENAKLTGMWENAPTQATDLTGVSWTE